MLKNKIGLFIYTLVVIVISSLITTAYFHHFVLRPLPEYEALISLSEGMVKKSPIKEDNTIIEIFSYGCHYCSANEENVNKLAEQMPAGTRLVRLHFNSKSGAGLASFSSLFSTLTVMGVEPQYRQKMYDAVLKEHLDLSQAEVRDGWLKQQGIDPEIYAQVSQSSQVQELQNYLTEVSSYYQIQATPSFIVNKKWLATQEGEFSDFTQQLLSLLQHDKPLVK
ncbi:thioredoxin domain-containing protein [Kalamiella sp. sgz302252]|uniref:thioredoxin domain-containing protein n=1 Tax=Pantoea sp. sgz302252 TaxID=3341827 RepID=UPI0036D3BC22